jgi:cation transport ATPase
MGTAMIHSRITKALVGLVALVLSFNLALAQDYTKKSYFSVDTKNPEAKLKIETVVNLLKGVSEAEMDLNSKKLTVKYNDAEIQEDMILFTIQSLGYSAKVTKEDTDKGKIGKSKDTFKDTTNK